MKTLSELRTAVTEAQQAYTQVAANPHLKVTRSYILANRHRDVRLAQSELIAAQRRAQVRGYRREIAGLKDQLLKQSEEYSALSLENQRLCEQNRQLIADSSRTAQRGNDWANDAETLAERVSDLEDGAKESRSEFEKVLEALEVPPTGKGIIKDMQRAVEGINNLWTLVRTSNNTAKPEAVEPAPKETTDTGATQTAVQEVAKAECEHKPGLLPMEVGRTGKVDRLRTTGHNSVTVGNETRGPEWGEGRAAAEFARLREEQAHIPLGHRVEHELRNVIQLRPDLADDKPAA